MKKSVLLVLGFIVLGLVGWYFMNQNQPVTEEIEYRYQKVEKGTLRRSISATGIVVAETAVEVKSRAGGEIVRLAVNEGDVVKKGDLIAVINPDDSETLYNQANADLEAANARADQARINLELQSKQATTAVQDAEANLAAARVRLQRVEIESKRQPSLSKASVANAEANLRSAEAALERLKSVDGPQQKTDAQTAVQDARTALEIAQREFDRQKQLLENGYVAQAAVDAAARTLNTARTNLASASQRLSTIDTSIQTQIRAAESNVAASRASLNQARTNTTQDEVALANLREARQAVRSAEITVRQAKDQQKQIDVRRAEYVAAKAATVRSKVVVDNAKVNLDSTTVVAPRDGVVTLKYLEEGTIIPPGTSTFAEGTSIVQLSDVSEMYVECAVDEADISGVRSGQKVSIVTEGFPGVPISGIVTRVNPSATTLNNITAVKVRVKIDPTNKIRVLPGMNATCEFITLELNDVVIAPSQAVAPGEAGKSTVRVKTDNPQKPEVREITVGETGNEGVEVKSGLSVGEEIVTAEINLAELRQIQQKMKEAEEGGGLAGGGGRGGGQRPKAKATTK
jgi:HlyD family secretion protein